MMTVGIDIGGRQHAVARCRQGQDKADREILRVTQDRTGFDRLDAWLARQDEPIGRITMESSGHYWMGLASHLGRQGVPVALVNPLGAKYFAKSRMSRTKSDPADARSLALMAQHDHTVLRDPLAGAELRQASRFAMTLVTEQARVCQRLVRLVELGFPELGELFDDPACRTAREVLRVAPTAAVARRKRTSTLAAANAGPGHRRLGLGNGLIQRLGMVAETGGKQPVNAQIHRPQLGMGLVEEAVGVDPALEQLGQLLLVMGHDG